MFDFAEMSRLMGFGGVLEFEERWGAE
jgi:hypothetical protein